VNPGASYILNNFDYGIGNVMLLSTSNVAGLVAGTDITWNKNQLAFDISRLGIGTLPGMDMGAITLGVEFVPVPAALPLMLSGLFSGLLFIARRRRTD
jgi:hypothetical protein